MGVSIRRADYYYTTARDQPGEVFRLLTHLADAGVNLLAFGAFPVGPDRSQLTLFPDDDGRLATFAQETGMVLDGPYPALMVQGDDRLGALADLHSRLHRVKVNVFASQGVADGRGGFGYLIYLRTGDVEAALHALQGLETPV